eukprot:136720-Pelagomonas_calceolata.AAC.4
MQPFWLAQSFLFCSYSTSALPVSSSAVVVLTPLLLVSTGRPSSPDGVGMQTKLGATYPTDQATCQLVEHTKAPRILPWRFLAVPTAGMLGAGQPRYLFSYLVRIINNRWAQDPAGVVTAGRYLAKQYLPRGLARSKSHWFPCAQYFLLDSSSKDVLASTGAALGRMVMS